MSSKDGHQENLHIHRFLIFKSYREYTLCTHKPPKSIPEFIEQLIERFFKHEDHGASQQTVGNKKLD